MASEETFPIHRCVFRNDTEGLTRILKDEEIKKQINSKDNHGNTPIHLALMLDRRNCVLILLRNGCDCVSRNNYGWNPLEEATMLGDMDLIEKLANLKLKAYNNYFNKKGGTLDAWNDILPAVYFKTQIKFKSKIPLIDKVGIKDTQKFYKRGNNFRADYGFSGIDLRGIPRMMKGSMSFIANLDGRGMVRVYLLDNKAKRYTEIYPSMPQSMVESYLKSKMDVKTLFKFYCDVTDLNIKKKSHKGSLFSSNKKRVIRINGNKKYNTDVYKFKDIDMIIRKRDNDFKKLIDANIHSLTNKRSTEFQDKVVKMIIRGSDDNGNPIVKSDILYINQLIPSYYSTYLKENHLSGEEKKKLEEIYDTVIKPNSDVPGGEKANDSNMIQNIKKSSNVTSMVHNLAGSVYNSSKKSSKSLKYEKTKKEPITEEEYFNPENKESLHMGRVMEINEEKKHLKTAFRMWLTKENTFPLNFYHIKPFIDMICIILFDQVNVSIDENNSDRAVYHNFINYVLKEINGSKRFPIKMEIPVFTGTVFQCKYIDLETDEKCAPESLFKIPSDYVYDETVSFKFLK